MVLISLLLSNLHCHSTVVEPKLEMSSLKSPNNLSAWQLVCLLRGRNGPKVIKLMMSRGHCYFGLEQ
jgi:hypothetical protein